MGRNGNAPRGLTKLSGRGVPWVSVLLTFIMGLIVFLPFPGWQKLVGFITSATVLSFSSGPLVLSAMRRQLPDQERPFRLPGGDVIPFLAFFSANLIVFWAGWDTNWKLGAAVLIGWVLLVVFQRWSRGTAPALQWRAGLWVIPWLVGLMVISLLGDYGGGLALLPLGWGALAVFGLTLAIFFVAIRLRLSSQAVVRGMEETPQDEPEGLTA